MNRVKLRSLFRYFLFSLLFVFHLLPCNGICFDTDEVVIITPEKVLTLNVRVAKNPEEWQQGLRGASGLQSNEGMLFVFPRESIITFTTKGVSFPIDIILINKSGRVAGVLPGSAFPKRGFWGIRFDVSQWALRDSNL